MTSDVISTDPTATSAVSTGRAPRERDWPAMLGSISAAATALAFVPMLVFHLRDVWGRPHYEFLPLLLPAAGALLWQRCRDLGALEPGDRLIAASLIGLVWLLLAGSILFVTSWLAGCAALASLLAAAYAVGGRRLVLAVLPAWAMLATSLPPPFHLDIALVGRLQALVSQRSSDLLDLLGITHVMEGNVIDLGGRPLLVDQACSGIYSLFTLGVCTLFYMLWIRASWPRLVVALLSALFWVIAGNILRVVAIAVLAANYDIDATAGRKHTALGLAGFGVMLAAVACTDRLVTFVTGVARLIRSALYGSRRKVAGATWSEILFRWSDYSDRWEARQAARRGSAGANPGQGESRARNRAFNRALDATMGTGSIATAEKIPPKPRPVIPKGPTIWPEWNRCLLGKPVVALSFLVLLPPQFLLPGHGWAEVLADRGVEARGFAELGLDSVPAQIAGFKRLGFAPVHRDHDLTWGEDSRIWAYKDLNGQVQVSLDYPFVGWHDLTECYNGRGWRVVNRSTVPDPSGGETVILNLTRDDGRFLRVIFGLFDRRFRALAPPYSRLDVGDVIRRRLALWGVGGPPPADMVGPTHQIQVALETAAPLPDQGGPDLLKLYRDATTALHQKPLIPSAAPGQEGHP